METITEIEKKRSMCRICLSGGNHYWLKNNDLAGTAYGPGTEVDTGEFEHFILLCQYPHALNDAVRMLSRRACSTGEIRTGLMRRHYSDQTIEIVLYKLSREKLTDDRSFAIQWSRYRTGKTYGMKRIRQELKQKGVSEENIEEAALCVDENTQLDQAIKYASKKLKGINGEEKSDKELQKVIRSLVQRGYDWDTAKQACREAVRIMDSEL